MRKIIIILLSMAGVHTCHAQLYDAQWVFAPNPSTVDFRNDTIRNSLLDGFFNITGTAANICDSSGNLLFSTNGVNIYDQYADTLFNGSNLSPCFYTTLQGSNGLNIPQATLFIPAPGNKNNYYLFHFSADTVNRPKKLFYTLIDNEYGFGDIVKKNIIFYENYYAIFRGGGMTACKHANGRDYWIVIGRHNSNYYFEFLLTPDTLLGPFQRHIGPAYNGPYDVAYSKFSPDGSKYATGCYDGVVSVFDFDRCSGEFTNPVSIYNETSNDPVHNPLTGMASLEFSPNGRFLYVSNRINLNQYDLLSNNIQDSVELYRADSTDMYQMDMLQLGPNGKLYASSWNGGLYSLHVINKPDEKGDSCGFVYGGLTTLTQDNNHLPNMINYKLGPLIGSGCDTIIATSTNTLKEEQLVRIQPNPANKYVYVEVPMQGEYELQLLNEMGQLIDKKETRQVDIFDTEHLSNGPYFITVIDKKNSRKLATQKIVMQH